MHVRTQVCTTFTQYVIVSLNLFQFVLFRELKKNRLRVIEGLSFQGLERLTTLNLRRNHIRELMDGAFWGLSAIQNL